MSNFSIGVDLGGTNLRIAAVDEQGTLLEKIALDTQVKLGLDRVIRDMCGAVEQLAAKYKSGGSLHGIGIGVPGIIDMKTGMLRESANMPGWGGSPVQAEIEERLGTRVILENDANVAALGENWLGVGRDVDDMAILTLGTGVGGGIVLGRRIWHGMTGMAGEFGHTTVEPDGVPCGCGNRGCLEQYASARAVIRMAQEAGVDHASARAVYNLAVQGEESAKKVFDRVGRALGIVIASAVNALNLPMYVLAGGVTNAWDAFSPSMFEQVRLRSVVFAATAPGSAPGVGKGASAQVEPGGSTRTIITRTALENDAGLYGAARLAMMGVKSTGAEKTSGD